MSIGGVFLAILFVVAFSFVFSITPARFKTEKKLTAAQLSAKGSNRGSQLLIGKFYFSIFLCFIKFIIIQVV
jgi:hypothetical protein